MPPKRNAPDEVYAKGSMRVKTKKRLEKIQANRCLTSLDDVLQGLINKSGWENEDPKKTMAYALRDVVKKYEEVKDVYITPSEHSIFGGVLNYLWMIDYTNPVEKVARATNLLNLLSKEIENTKRIHKDKFPAAADEPSPAAVVGGENDSEKVE